MGGNKAFEFKKRISISIGHEHADENHAKRHVLRWDGEEEVVDLHSTLVLCYGIAHGEDECANVEAEVKPNKVIDGLSHC